MPRAARVAQIWRYPVKSMGGERIDRSAVGERRLHADWMWAVRDPALGAITTARRLPSLLKCTARYQTDPPTSQQARQRPRGGGHVPGGEEVSSAEPQVHARLSDLVGKEVRLEPLPPLSEKDHHRAPRDTKADLRAHFGSAHDEPLPDLSVFPLRKLAELSRYVTPVGSLVDSYPLHLITLASLAAMAQDAPDTDFEVRRFRPNLSRHGRRSWTTGELMVRR